MNGQARVRLATSASEQWATFYVADEVLALPVEDVQEVLMEQPLTPIPMAPTHIVGLLNLRGWIMPAIDLRLPLGFEERQPSASVKLLVVKSQEGPMAVIVDEIGDVLRLPEACWQPPPDTLSTQQRRFVARICAIDADIVLALDLSVLCWQDERQDERQADEVAHV
jgi:purine-binding chemotaxis protein CheW